GRARPAARVDVAARPGRAGGVVGGGGAPPHEHDTPAVRGDEVELSVGAGVVAGQDAVAEPPQEAGRGPLGAGAEPAPPPRPPGGGESRHETPPGMATKNTKSHKKRAKRKVNDFSLLVHVFSCLFVFFVANSFCPVQLAVVSAAGAPLSGRFDFLPRVAAPSADTLALRSRRRVALPTRLRR